MRALLTTIGATLVLAAAASAQPLPVDAQFCNVTCESAAADARCRVGLVGGLALSAERRDLLPLAAGDGVEMGGDLSIPTGDGGGIVLAEAAIQARFSQPSPNACQVGFDVVRGLARLPVPGAGALASASIEVVEQPLATIGLELGRNLIPSSSPWCLPEFGIQCECEDLCIDTVPILRSDAHYFSFDVDTKYVFRVAGFDLPSSPGVAATFVLDASDPYFYLTGSAMGIPGLKTPLNASSGGFGFSWNDEIPYVPLQTYPFGDLMQPFRGGYAAQIALPIFETEAEQVKVLMDGQLIASLDPDADGDHPFRTPEAFLGDPDLALGANGAFSVRFSPFKKKEKGKDKPGKKDKPKKEKEEKPTSDKDVQKEGKKAKKSGLANTLLAMTFEAGTGSAVGRVRPDRSELYLSGALGNSQNLLPEWMPIPVGAGAGTQLAAYFSTNVEESFVQAEGGLGLDTTTLARWVKMEELGTVLGVDGLLRVDQTGFLVRGSSSAQMHPDVTPSGMAAVEARIAPNGVDTYISFQGAMAVAGEVLPDGEIVFSPRGVEISGTLQYDEHEFLMVGSFRGREGRLEGHSQVEIEYSREDTLRKLELLDQLVNQSKLVEAGEASLADAEADVEVHRRNSEAVARDLAVAIAQVEALQDEIDAIDVSIAQKHRDIAAQNARNCNADYTGCPSCSSCSSRCNCSFGDVACYADCGVCETARTACLAARETCRVANIAICNADKAAKIAALGVEIAALETARASVVAAKDVALGVLEPIEAANALALAGLATAEATLETVLDGLNAARAGLARIQGQLDNLPAIEGTVLADVAIVIETGSKGTRKSGTVEATFEGRKIGDGRVDLEAQPAIACVTPKLREVGEICTAL